LARRVFEDGRDVLGLQVGIVCKDLRDYNGGPTDPRSGRMRVDDRREQH
jgi:hypothetical protein